MDAGQIITIVTEPPFWGFDGEPRDILNPNDVILVATVMENDAGKPGFYRGLVQGTMAAAVTASISAPNYATRVSRILTDLQSTLDGYPTNNVPFVPSDDHVGSKALLLNVSDLIPSGTLDRTLQIGNGDEGEYELTFRITRHQGTMFAQNAHLAMVTRDPKHMEVWGVDLSGTVRGNWFDGRWQGWYRLTGARFHQDTFLAAVSRHNNHMEVFGVGEDGHVRGCWFEDGWHDWYKLDDLIETSATFRQATPLAVVSRNRNHMELWGVDETGHLRGAWFDDGHWRGWYTLALPNEERFPPASQLAALSRHPNHQEVWVLDDGGTVRGVHFLDDSWRTWITFGGARFLAGTHIEAISRHADQMELFAVDRDGILRGLRFDGEWKKEYAWYPFVNAAFTPGTDVAAVSRHPDRMELWVLGRDDGILRGNWFDQGTWQSNWYMLDQAGFNQGTDVVAISRSHQPGGIIGPVAELLRGPERMEVLTVGQDGIIRGRSFDVDQWYGWYMLRWSFEG
jgi:hypothetical protein